MLYRSLFLILIFVSSVFTQSLTWLGSMGTPYAEVHGVSDDGMVVTGWAGVYSPHRAWRWTPSTGMQDIGSLAPGYDAEAWGLSADGQVIVGYGLIGVGSVYRGFRWKNDSMYQFGTFGGSVSWAYAASFDGSVVAGSAEHSNGYNHAFRWTADSGMQDLGVLPGALRSVARGVSADGRVVVGWSGFENQVHHAFRWENGVMVDIHNPALYGSEALGVSDDGNVVVGAWGPNMLTPARAFRWTASTGMYDLGTLGGNWSEAWDANYNGSIVVGWAERSTGNWGAFRWKETTGMQDLNVLYANLLTPGSVLRDAFAISSNGRYIAGRGYNAATGRNEAYLLDTQGTSVAEKSENLQIASRLYQNYPNPFSRVTTITYEIPFRTSVQLEVYDGLGRKVGTLVNEIQNAGKYSVKFVADNFSNGIYFYTLKTEKSVNVNRMELLK
ncbi:MAG: T9SS type A sorting domain-containing protein [candidate division WOR-3 bacterium]